MYNKVYICITKFSIFNEEKLTFHTILSNGCCPFETDIVLRNIKFFISLSQMLKRCKKKTLYITVSITGGKKTIVEYNAKEK